MAPFKVVNNIYDVQISDKWQPSVKFSSKGEVRTYKGREYRLISKKEREFSSMERVGRAVLGALAVVGTLGLGYLSKDFKKSINKLFYNEKKTVQYATLLKSTHELEKDLRGSSLLSDKELIIQLQKDYSALSGHIKIYDELVEMGSPGFALNRGTGVTPPSTLEEMFPGDINAFFGPTFPSIAPMLTLLLQQGHVAEISIKAPELIQDEIPDTVFHIPHYPDFELSKVNDEIFLLVTGHGSLRNTLDRTEYGNYTVSERVNLTNLSAKVELDLIKG